MLNAWSCSAWRLYVILDRAAAGSHDLAKLAEAAIRGGADALQLRDKTASTEWLSREGARVMPIARAAGIPLIINDHAEVARAVGADGVHLGQEDGPIAPARAMLGVHGLVGRSTHSLQQALAAEAEGADYIGFGPVFATPTKPTSACVGVDAIRSVIAQVRIPVVCIGGIDAWMLPEVVRAGARCVAVVRAVCAASEPQAAARALKLSLISQSGRSETAASV